MKVKQIEKITVKLIRVLSLMLVGFLFIQCGYGKSNKHEIIKINPYKNVDWATFQQHKAAIHFHTLQSDGYHPVKDVVNHYLDHGFTILSITDHDWNYPNARIKWGHLPEEKASSYPEDPKPKNYPANPTWPWTDYGTLSPQELGIVGIQGNELTFRHHINSYFSDYGVWYERTGSGAPYGGIVDKEGNEVWEDDQLYGVKDKGGLAIINHPGIPDDEGWWERKSLDWYLERFEKHSSSYLVGIEVGNIDNKQIKYNVGLWDQLNTRLMPERPVWGNGTDDMHNLSQFRESYTVFLLDELTDEAVREAMINGQYYFCRSNRVINVQEGDKYGAFPVINKIEVDEQADLITIVASDYDEIRWISAPEILEPLTDYKISNEPWDLGRIVGVEKTLDLNTEGIKKFVRAELIKMSEGNTYITYTNPFGI